MARDGADIYQQTSTLEGTSSGGKDLTAADGIQRRGTDCGATDAAQLQPIMGRR